MDDTAFIYVIEADQGVKVGMTLYDVSVRLRDLGRSGGFYPQLVRAYAVESRKRARVVELQAHTSLAETRTTGEWFHCHPFEATAAVERALRATVPVADDRDEMARLADDVMERFFAKGGTHYAGQQPYMPRPAVHAAG